MQNVSYYSYKKMENNLIKRDINQINDDIKVISSSSIVLLCTLLSLILSITIWLFAGTVTEKAHIRGVVFPDSGMTDVCLPQAGVMRNVFVQKGQEVKAGQQLALVSVGNSYSVVTASSDGIVFSCKQEGESFGPLEPVVNLIDKNAAGRTSVILLAYSDLMNLKDIAAGQDVQVWPSNEKSDEVGYVRGTVASVGRYPVKKTEAAKKIKAQAYLDELLPEGVTSYEIIVNLAVEKDNPNLLDWTFDSGNHPDMSVGTLCDAIVITHTYKVFEYLFLKAKAEQNKIHRWIE